MAAGSKRRIDHWDLEDSAPAYLKDAMKDLGVQEWIMKGGRKVSNPVVERYIEKAIGHPADAIATPWCAGWVGAKLEYHNIACTKSLAARSYLRFGNVIWDRKVNPREEMQQNAQEGDIVVLMRGRTDDGIKGHVGFLLGFDDDGNPVLISANDEDAVLIASFPASRVLGIVRPKGIAQSRTIRALGGSGISETTNQAVQALVPEPSQLKAIDHALDTVQSIEGPVRALSTYKPWITAALSITTVALIILAAYYRHQDYQNGRNN